MENRLTYSDKLKNPKWQKIRLKVFERDNWTCRKCHRDDKTLIIHHKLYLPNIEPWDYSYDLLITLCEECHELEKINTEDAEQRLLRNIKSKFMSSDIYQISGAFKNIPMEKNTFAQSVFIYWFFTNYDQLTKKLKYQFKIFVDALKEDGFKKMQSANFES